MSMKRACYALGIFLAFAGSTVKADDESTFKDAAKPNFHGATKAAPWIALVSAVTPDCDLVMNLTAIYSELDIGAIRRQTMTMLGPLMDDTKRLPEVKAWRAWHSADPAGSCSYVEDLWSKDGYVSKR